MTANRSRYGTGTLRLRSKRQPDGVASWELRWYGESDPVTGKRPRLRETYKGTRKQANTRLRELVDASETGTLTQPTDETVAKFLGRWLDHIKVDVSRKTHERYAELVKNNITPLLGRHKLAALRASHIRKAWVDAAESGRKDGKGGLSPQTVKHMHRVLHGALGFAVEDRVLARNPASEKLARPPAVEQAHEIRALTAGQLRAVLAHMKVKHERMHLPALVAASTGMRRGEIFGLRWRDLDIEARVIRVEKALEQTGEGLRLKSPKTKGSRRRIAIGPELADALRAHKVEMLKLRLALGLGKLKPDDMIFTSPDGGHVNLRSFSQMFGAAVEAFSAASEGAVPAVSFHDLRHTHATLLLADKVNPKLVSQRLGHSTVAVTLSIYGHVLPGSDEEAAENFEAAFLAG